MAVTVTELFPRELGDNSATLHYEITGTDDDATARTALLATAPTSHNSLARDDAMVAELGPSLWKGTVIYKRDEDAEPTSSSSPKYQFSTRGSTEHITTSILTIHTYPVSAPDCKQAIGVSQGRAEGTDILTAGFDWSETHYFSDAAVTDAYIGKLFALSLCCNNAPFKYRKGGSAEFATSEVLFLGVEGGKLGNGDWELAFHFSARPNRTDIQIGDMIDIYKAGHEYLWVRFSDKVSENQVVPQPLSVHVEKVYYYGNFADLGIR